MVPTESSSSPCEQNILCAGIVQVMDCTPGIRSIYIQGMRYSLLFHTGPAFMSLLHSYQAHANYWWTWFPCCCLMASCLSGLAAQTYVVQPKDGTQSLILHSSLSLEQWESWGREMV